ncbi:hypothetical protein BN946_scf184858.g13 [Trametes cinnabarina]|uniref:Uncharacterized protein n=1 Tax=Pycnoporus cinnabarinus TaxID=5643 RepID=A0A060SSX6_PYCCI|nr:hypothetical protein BN946_scf184858.g13 [Trametes cinnabarina]
MDQRDHMYVGLLFDSSHTMSYGRAVLMSGSNDNMTEVARVVSGLDGTDATLSPFSWTCPNVDPYSAIYFYQFTNGDDTQDSAWTTRFTISSPDGRNAPPEHEVQPSGEAIPWGIGHLQDSKGSLSAQATTVDRHSTDVDDSPRDDSQDDEGASGSVPSPTSTHSQGDNISYSSGSSGITSDSLYWTANSLSFRPTRTSQPSDTGVAVEDLVPTASLPAKKVHSTYSGAATASFNGSYANGMACSGMGPGVPQVGSMQLASGTARDAGPMSATMSLHFVALIMLLRFWL